MIAAPTLTGYTPHLYADVRTLLEHGPVEPPKPDYGFRNDGNALFYKGHTNDLIGDPESGKTWIALCAAADVLFLRGSVLLLDLDHNGAQATISRLRSMGVPTEALSDPERFRYCEPEDVAQVLAVLADAKAWRPDFVLIDSVGELLPLFGANSNNPDDFTRVHTAAIKPFATLGSCVVLIDHLAKGRDSRVYGATGTAAKKRACSGAMFRVTVDQVFSPGTGGSAELVLLKDRHGGLRAVCAPEKEPLAARFTLIDRDGALTWELTAPEKGERPRAGGADLLVALEALEPAPRSVRDVMTRCGWGNDKATKAMQVWREKHGTHLSLVE